MKEATLKLEPRVEQADMPGQSQDTVAPVFPPPAGFWQRLASRVRSCFQIPYGYEDEYGFHLGQEPVPADIAAQLAETRKTFTDRDRDVMQSPSPAPPKSVESPVEERRQTAW